VPKITLTELASLTNETTALSELNQNFETIQDAIDNLLSRDGTSPNSMDANLDMNSFRIENLPEAVGNTEPVRLGDLEELVAAQTNTTKWYFGSGAPSGSLYEVNDLYLDNATYDVYQKSTSSSWTLVGNIKGATGATGPAGAGSGDMLKATYDANDDGVVDSAASVPWSGVTSKPTTAVGYGITDVPFSLLTSKPTTLSGYGITDAQPLDDQLTALAGQTWANDRFTYYTGTATAALGTITAAGRALLDDADAAAQRTTLGLGTMALRTAISTGDLVNGAVTLAKLDTTGAVGQVLTAQGAGVAPIWSAAGGSSAGSALLSSGTPTAATTYTVTGLSLASYRKLHISWTNIRHGSLGSFRIAGQTVTSTSAATTETFSGFVEIDLISGLGAGVGRRSGSSTLTIVGLNFSVLNNTTSITFSPSAGSFVAQGTITIRGLT
jgi:hypothetical protein